MTDTFIDNKKYKKGLFVMKSDLRKGLRKVGKKLIVSTLAVMCLLGITVMAEGGYTPIEHTYSSNEVDGAKTIMIYKGDVKEENIYFVDQCSVHGGFSNFTALLKMGDAPAGTYTVYVDGETSTFEISDAEAAFLPNVKMEFLGAAAQDDKYYSVGYGVTAENAFNAASKIIMVLGDKAYATDMSGDNSIINWNAIPQVEGEGSVSFAIQLDYVGAEYMNIEDVTPKFDMFFKN